jgi:hypothetical protein
MYIYLFCLFNYFFRLKHPSYGRFGRSISDSCANTIQLNAPLPDQYVLMVNATVEPDVMGSAYASVSLHEEDKFPAIAISTASKHNEMTWSSRARQVPCHCQLTIASTLSC